MDINDYLQYMRDIEASDLYLSTDAPASVKINGKLHQINQQPLSAEKISDIAHAIMNPEQIVEFEHTHEMNLALPQHNLGRFRVNIFQQRGEVSVVIRRIETTIPTIEHMHLPEIFKDLVMETRGLILVVGVTGSGKSTSLAAMLNHRNERTAGHIICIEDPIEFIHEHKQSIVNQREVGVDTLSYEEALKNALRQAPDMIVIGEIRSREIMEEAIAFAETGHLCLSTLHANNANQTIERILNFFPEERHRHVLLDLSLNLKAIISQRLVNTLSKKRTAAIEILLGTPRICDLIHRGDTIELKSTMEKSETRGMVTFDTALFQLYKNKVISLDEALRNANSQNNLRLKISLLEHNEKSMHPDLKIEEDSFAFDEFGNKINMDSNKKSSSDG